MLSPRGSQILPKPVSGPENYRAGDTTQLKEELDEDRVHSLVLFPFDQ